jgi:hypothetical protein
MPRYEKPWPLVSISPPAKRELSTAKAKGLEKTVKSPHTDIRQNIVNEGI